MKYLLEMLCELEFESSPAERDALFSNWLVNPSGQPRHFSAGDILQEQLQDELYEHIGRKDTGFDENYMRQVIAPDTHRFILVKKGVNEGLGLAQCVGKHPEPSTRPEIRKLMELYQECQLHCFRRGRTYNLHDDLQHRQVDDLG